MEISVGTMIGKDVMLEQEHINVMTVGGAKNSGLGVDAIAVVAARRRWMECFSPSRKKFRI